MAIEVMSVLMLMKIMAPKNLVMLRGNHESRIMAELYNFKQECNEKYGQQIFEMFMDAFDSLPIACIVNQKYFCVHGGITDKLKTVLVFVKCRSMRCKRLSAAYKSLWQGHTVTLSGLIQQMFLAARWKQKQSSMTAVNAQSTTVDNLQNNS